MGWLEDLLFVNGWFLWDGWKPWTSLWFVFWHQSMCLKYSERGQ